MILLRPDQLGNLQWSTLYGGVENSGAKTIEQTSDGGYILGGGSTSIPGNSGDMFLVKTDSIGFADSTFSINVLEHIISPTKCISKSLF